MKSILVPGLVFGLLAVHHPQVFATDQDLTGGSLWLEGRGNSHHSMFSDRKASQVGDILTITVLESSMATASQSTNTNRTSSVSDAVSQFLFSSATSGRFTSGGESPSISWGGDNQYTAGGEVQNRHNLNARAAVLVVDVLPNRTLVIEGVRKIIFSEETTYVHIRGLVRPDDVRFDNTVLSSNIAEAHVEFITEGSIDDTRRRGWLTRIYDIVNPF